MVWIGLVTRRKNALSGIPKVHMVAAIIPDRCLCLVEKPGVFFPIHNQGKNPVFLSLFLFMVPPFVGKNLPALREILLKKTALVHKRKKELIKNRRCIPFCNIAGDFIPFQSHHDQFGMLLQVRQGRVSTVLPHIAIYRERGLFSRV